MTTDTEVTKNAETAINTLTSKITEDVKADEALKFTQSALNLAHVIATINNLRK